MEVFFKRALLAGISGAALLGAASPGYAAQGVAMSAAAAAAAAGEVDTVIVTGTRMTGLRAADSPAPVEVIDQASLTRAGKTDLINALSQLVPSFNAQAFGGDTAALTLTAKLRGVSPNHALVLINGKRRHTTANLAVLGGAYQGAASADLNFIPLLAIDHVEVLTDGAAAQYGTDAIAGVINIILKDRGEGGTVMASGGAYYKNDGKTGELSANMGFTPFPNAFLNVTALTRYHDFSDRGGPDMRLLNPTTIAAHPDWPSIIAGYPHANKISGDARYNLNVVAYDAGYDFGNGLHAYSFGTWGKKYAAAYENYRLPNRVPAVWPRGFNPMETSKETDYGVTGGLKGKLFADWNFDLSTTYGKDEHAINVTNSANPQLFADTGATPTWFHAGDFISTQWTTNLDFSREFEVGMASPLTVAFGAEHRRETYEIKAGDPASRYKAGSQSYPGFALSDAGNHTRENYAAYVDLAGSPIENLKLDLAGRYEHFSDFGETTVGKLTGRYDFTPAFAIRGTVSTGFRAPTMAEEFYSATNVSPTSAFVQLPPVSPGARLLGINGLKPEKSTNYSVGFVAHPGYGISLTVDAYQIEIRDRVVGSGSLFGKVGGVVVNPTITAAIAANGNSLDPTVGTTGINIFTNGLDTRTRGVEALAAYASDFGEFGHVDWTLGANYNDTKVIKIAAPPAGLGGAKLFDQTAIANLEHASPKYKISLGALYTNGPWTINLVETLFGEAYSYSTVNGVAFFKDRIEPHVITNLEFDYQVVQSVKVALGANNLFDTFPETLNPAGRAANIASGSAATALYPSFSPFGINGGYYYARVTYTF